MKAWLLWFVPVGCLALGFGGLRLAQLSQAPRGQQPPEDFRLPSYPGAYEFKSSVSNPKSQSLAYLVKEGSADDVADFYRKKLTSEKYRVAGDQRIRLGVPPAKKGAKPRSAPARHVFFTNRDKNRVVLLTAVEHPVNAARTQVTLAFGPLDYWEHPPVDPEQLKQLEKASAARKHEGVEAQPAPGRITKVEQIKPEHAATSPSGPAPAGEGG